MSVAGINSAKGVALASPTPLAVPSIRAGGLAVSWQKAAVIALALSCRRRWIALGLGAVGFAEDEINKVDAARAYNRGDFTANAEHPMLVFKRA